MENRRPLNARLAVFLVASVAAFGQTGSSARIVVVDGIGAQIVKVDAADRTTTDARRGAPATRLIDRNESGAIGICLEYVDAQLSYFRVDHGAQGYLTFAPKIRSTPGKRDGLFWPADVAEEESPMGPVFAAAAAAEEPAGGHPTPLFGYYYKILLAQGPEAVGGARDYRVEGRLIAGFALVAWPAEYGVSGARSFLVNQLGDVYAKDLGPGTSRIASGMCAYAPDAGWKRVASNADMR
jgi:hypothetical protein